MALKLFYSYSTEDEELRDQLEKHLSLLRRQRVIEEWHFRKIVAGRNFEDDIDQNLEAADVILLLISSGFLNSDYCWNKEMKRALERQGLGQARVIPIIVRACDWQWDGAPFANLEALPRDGKPVTSWGNRDEAWTDVAKGLRASIDEFIKAAPKTGEKEAQGSTQASTATDRVELFPVTGGISPAADVALISCVVIEDTARVRSAIAQLKEDLLHDSYVRRVIPSLEDLRKQVVSYGNDDPEIRSRVIDRIATLPFEGYACFAKSSFFATLDESTIRGKLFGRLLYERLRAYRRKQIRIDINTFSDLTIVEAQNLVDDLLRDIRDREGIVLQNPPTVAAIKPDDACAIVANYVSAITLKKLESPDSLEARLFEKIRSKMRLIHDAANEIFYSRDRQLP